MRHINSLLLRIFSNPYTAISIEGPVPIQIIELLDSKWTAK